MIPLLGQWTMDRLALDEATLLEVTEVSRCDDRITIQITDEHRRRLIAAIKKVNATITTLYAGWHNNATPGEENTKMKFVDFVPIESRELHLHIYDLQLKLRINL